MMIPDEKSVGICFEMRTKPVGDQEKFASAVRIICTAPQIVIAKAILRDRDGIVLGADFPVVIQQRNSVSVISSAIIGLLGEGHVVFAELSSRSVLILG